MKYVYLECRNEQCLLRFPVRADEKVQECPACHGRLRIASSVDKDVDALRRDDVPGVQIIAVLDNIRSIHNVGSMFRTADGAGVRMLHLCGITATPENPRLAKAALGAQHNVGWRYHRNGVAAVRALVDDGYRVWAVERLVEHEGSQALFDVSPPVSPVALVVGNEHAGIDPDIVALADNVVSLPMIGEKSSLNVAVAFGIATYYVRFATRQAGIEATASLRY